MLKDQAMLKSLERDLQERLDADLPAVAAGEDSLYFYNSDHNPFDFAQLEMDQSAQTVRIHPTYLARA